VSSPAKSTNVARTRYWSCSPTTVISTGSHENDGSLPICRTAHPPAVRHCRTSRRAFDSDGLGSASRPTVSRRRTNDAMSNDETIGTTHLRRTRTRTRQIGDRPKGDAQRRRTLWMIARLRCLTRSKAFFGGDGDVVEHEQFLQRIDYIDPIVDQQL
jgi:hypothetical protein